MDHYAASAPPQLFHLDRDPHELTDLADQQTEDIQAALAEGQDRLYAICDPDACGAGQAGLDQASKA